MPEGLEMKRLDNGDVLITIKTQEPPPQDQGFWALQCVVDKAAFEEV